MKEGTGALLACALGAVLEDADASVPSLLRPALAEAAREIREIEGRIRTVERQVDAVAEQTPVGSRLRSIRRLPAHALDPRSARGAVSCEDEDGAAPDRLRAWALHIERLRGHNKAAVALANKLARIAWGVWKYSPRATSFMARSLRAPSTVARDTAAV